MAWADQVIYVPLYQLTKQIGMRENIKGFRYDESNYAYFWSVVKE